jgi:hypothetical protein
MNLRVVVGVQVKNWANKSRRNTKSKSKGSGSGVPARVALRVRVEAINLCSCYITSRVG